MPELQREPNEQQLQYALKPLKQIEAQRAEAFDKRAQAIAGAYNAAIRRVREDVPWDGEQAQQQQSELAWLIEERERKLEQLNDLYEKMMEKSTIEKLKKGIQDFSDHSATKAVGYAGEVASGAHDAIEIAAHGILMSNPVTAILGFISLADKWIGRGIGWVQMAKKQWDADCSRISIRIAKHIGNAYKSSEFRLMRTTGNVFAGADKSTISRQRLEKNLYHLIMTIREDQIKYKIKETEVTQEAQALLAQKQAIEAKLHECRGVITRLKANQAGTNAPASSNARRLFGRAPASQAMNGRIAELETKCSALEAKCVELSNKIVDLLNEVVDNASRLINQTQADVDRMVQEIVASFAVTEFQSKFTGSHTQGSWRQSIRRAFS